jgi:hypothetical protein
MRHDNLTSHGIFSLSLSLSLSLYHHHMQPKGTETWRAARGRRSGQKVFSFSSFLFLLSSFSILESCWAAAAALTRHPRPTAAHAGRQPGTQISPASPPDRRPAGGGVPLWVSDGPCRRRSSRERPRAACGGVPRAAGARLRQKRAVACPHGPTRSVT